MYLFVQKGGRTSAPIQAHGSMSALFCRCSSVQTRCSIPTGGGKPTRENLACVPPQSHSNPRQMAEPFVPEPLQEMTRNHGQQGYQQLIDDSRIRDTHLVSFSQRVGFERLSRPAFDSPERKGYGDRSFAGSTPLAEYAA